MSKTITQTVVFPGASAKEVYGIYMSSKKHSEATGAPAELTRKVGEKFTAHAKYIKGTNIWLEPNKMIVQSWRGKDWDRSHGPSILTLRFRDGDEGCVMEMVHACVPEDAAPHLKKGWQKMYWTPFKRYLNRQRA